MAVADVLVDAVLANRYAAPPCCSSPTTSRPRTPRRGARWSAARASRCEVVEVLRVDDDRWHRCPRTGRRDAVRARRRTRSPPSECSRARWSSGPGGVCERLAGRHRPGRHRPGGARGDRFAGPGGRLEGGGAPVPAERGAVAAATHPLTLEDRAQLDARTRVDCSCSSPCADPRRRVGEITRQLRQVTSTLWRELVRRSPRSCSRPPSSLLAFAAWQHGDGALAWCAIDRCLEVDPDYTHGALRRRGADHAVPPAVWQQLREEELPVFRGGRSTARSSDRAS